MGPRNKVVAGCGRSRDGMGSTQGPLFDTGRVAKGMIKMPMSRTTSAMAHWDTEAVLYLAKYALGEAVDWFNRDLEECSDSERDKLQKLLGVLLAKEGPLSEQPHLRKQIVNEVSRRSDLRHHGARVYAAVPGRRAGIHRWRGRAVLRCV